MIYCLDTNICIYLMKNAFPKLKTRMLLHSPEQIALPSMVKAELLFGCLKSDNPEKSKTAVEAFMGTFAVLPFGDRESFYYATIRALLERGGSVIGPNDMMIAATVMAHDAVLVTRNTKEFSRVNGLVLQDWTA